MKNEHKKSHDDRISSLRMPRAFAGVRVCCAGTPTRRELGQALTEYSLLIVVVAAISAALLLTFNSKVRPAIFTFNATLERELEVGNVSQEPGGESGWSN